MANRSNRRRPPATQTRKKRGAQTNLSDAYWDITHRPLQCLVFLIPLVLVYEVGMALVHSNVPLHERPGGLAAEQLLRWFFSLFGAGGAYLPGVVLVVVLLVWHMAGRYPWKVGLQPMIGMSAESILLVIPLLLLHWLLPGRNVLAAGAVGRTAWEELLLSIGAGIYEELVFRLIAIALLTLVLIDILGMKQVAGVALAVIISSLLFAQHHYAPIGKLHWNAGAFAFQAAAGAYLAAIFVLRGFGLAVGCHAIYDVIAFLRLV